MSLKIYKLIHLLGFAMLFFGLGGVLFANAISSAPKAKIKLLGAITHGVGLVLVLVSGFGMAAKLGLTSGFPLWIYAKIGLWIYLGAGIAIAKRKASMPFIVTVALLAAGLAAAYLGLNKPF